MAEAPELFCVDFGTGVAIEGHCSLTDQFVPGI
jgi:hypothetical protein